MNNSAIVDAIKKLPFVEKHHVTFEDKLYLLHLMVSNVQIVLFCFPVPTVDDKTPPYTVVITPEMVVKYDNTKKEVHITHNDEDTTECVITGGYNKAIHENHKIYFDYEIYEFISSCEEIIKEANS